MNDERAPEAPQTSAHRRDLAGFWRRVGGYMIDLLILWVPLLGLAAEGFYPIFYDRLVRLPQPQEQFPLPMLGWPLPLTSTDLLLALVSWIVVPAYFAWGYSRGRTLGCHVAGLRIVDDDTGRRPGLAKGLGRCMAQGVWSVPFIAGDVAFPFASSTGSMLVRLLTFLLGLLPLMDCLSMLWDPDKQTMHDKLAGTYVIATGRSTRPPTLGAVARAPRRYRYGRHERGGRQPDSEDPMPGGTPPITDTARPHRGRQRRGEAMYELISGKDPYDVTFAEARAYAGSDAVAMLEGDDGGEVYVVCPVSLIHCDAPTLRQLLLDLDAIEWAASAPDSARMSFFRASLGERVGMMGGLVTEGVWVNPALKRNGLEPLICAVLAGERPAIG